MNNNNKINENNNMYIKEIDVRKLTENQTDFLKNAKWGAINFMHKLIAEDKFFSKFGYSSRTFFMYVNDNPIGLGNIFERDYIEVPEKDIFIGMIYVDPQYRGLGYSSKMVKHLEDILKKEGKEEVSIVTQHKGLYEKSGYSLVREVDGPHEHDYFYTKKLTD